MLGNMEKAPVETDASNVTKDDVSHKATQQDDDPKPDYSSKATTKTKLTDYLRIFTYSTLGDRLLLVGLFPTGDFLSKFPASCVCSLHRSIEKKSRVTLFQLHNFHLSVDADRKTIRDLHVLLKSEQV
jgi:hypothetical protein